MHSPPNAQGRLTFTWVRGDWVVPLRSRIPPAKNSMCSRLGGIPRGKQKEVQISGRVPFQPRPPRIPADSVSREISSKQLTVIEIRCVFS